MKYLVEFAEETLVRRIIQCEVEAESEEDAKLQIKSRNCNYIDSWDDDEISSEFIEITNIEKYDED